MFWAAAIPAAMSLAGSIMGNRSAKKQAQQAQRGQQRQMEESRQYLNQIPGVAHEVYDPYINQGMESSQTANNEYNKMAKDPTSFVDEIMKKYKPSEGYNFKEGRMLGAARNSAASGGFAGTPYDQEQQAELVQGLLGSDMQEFLRNILGVHERGVAGHEGRANRGFNASSFLGDALIGGLNQQGGLAFQGEGQRNQNMMDRRNAMMQGQAGIMGSMQPFAQMLGQGMDNKQQFGNYGGQRQWQNPNVGR